MIYEVCPSIHERSAANPQTKPPCYPASHAAVLHEVTIHVPSRARQRWRQMCREEQVQEDGGGAGRSENFMYLCSITATCLHDRLWLRGVAAVTHQSEHAVNLRGKCCLVSSERGRRHPLQFSVLRVLRTWCCRYSYCSYTDHLTHCTCPPRQVASTHTYFPADYLLLLLPPPPPVPPLLLLRLQLLRLPLQHQDLRDDAEFSAVFIHMQ